MLAPFFDTTLDEPDWHDVDRLLVRCGSCDHQHHVTAGDGHATDRTSTCPSCDTVIDHPADADLARCLSCGLLLRAGTIPASVRARNGLARVEFDGWTVRLTRLWCPVPRWRHRRIPLDRIARAGYDRPLGDAGSAVDIRFTVECRGGERDRRLWLWALRNRHPPRERRFNALAVAVNEAVDGRIRLLVEESVGLGPWGEREWHDIEARVPEVREVYRYPPSRTHREAIDWMLRGIRDGTEPLVVGWPRHVPGLPTVDREPSGWSRPMPEIWHLLADRLSGAADVRSSPRWDAGRRTVLGHAHHWSTVSRSPPTG
jgi:hypothetical protein